MNNLKTLVLMQLKDKVDFSFMRSKKESIFKIVFSILKFAIITGLIYLAFMFLSILRLVSLQGGIPTDFFSIIFGLMVLLSVIVCIFGLTKSLYLAKDNQVLLTMPTSRINVFISKLIVYTIYEFLRNLTYILPLLVAFGLINSMPIYFYAWAVVACAIITLLTVSIGALLSIPMLYITFIVKKSKVLEYSLITVAIGFLVFVVISLISLIPENIDIVGSWGTLFWQIQDFFTMFVESFAWVYYLAVAFVGIRYGVVNQLFISSQLISLLVILGIIVVVSALTFWLVRPLFFRMATKSFEYTRKLGETKNKNKVHSVFFGGLKKELLITTRTSEKFNSLLIIAIVLPIAILLLNKIFGAMDTRLTGTYMTLAFNVLLILLIALSSNGMVAKIFSEEGLSGYINKTVPASYIKVLSTKLVPFLAIINLSLLASCIIFGIYAGFSALNIIVMFICTASLYSGHLFYSASLDIMNPQVEQYATTGTHTNNPNELKSTLVAFLISAFIAFVFYILIGESTITVWYKILFISLAYVVWNVYMFVSKIKVYYKEK